MRKAIIFLLTLIFVSKMLFAQNVNNETEAIKTKMDIFSSNAGTITKFIDTILPNLNTPSGDAKTQIRKIINGEKSSFFYQITKQGKYRNIVASIEYSDLLEILNSIKKLQSEAEKDVASNPDYLENKFETIDGFQVGYYVSSGKVNWFIKLEKYGSENTLYIYGLTIEAAFSGAKNKIEELKK